MFTLSVLNAYTSPGTSTIRVSGLMPVSASSGVKSPATKGILSLALVLPMSLHGNHNHQYLLERTNQNEVNVFLSILGSGLILYCRSARVQVSLPSSMQTQSFQRGTPLLVLCAQCVVTSLSSQRVLVNFKRARGLYYILQCSVFTAYMFLGMPMSTMLLFKARDTIPSQR